MVEAVATSLVVVAAMGLSTSASYAMSGKVSLAITCWLIVGGVLGGVVGVALAERLKNARALSTCSMPSCSWRWPCICYLKAYETEGNKHAHPHLPPSTLLFGRARSE